MAGLRADLSTRLTEFCSNTYFQPPTGTRLTYPCIVYSLDAFDVLYADNEPYRTYDKYTLTYITRDPDDINIRALAKMKRCRFDRPSVSDNLYHYYYTLYW